MNSQRGGIFGRILRSSAPHIKGDFSPTCLSSETRFSTSINFSLFPSFVFLARAAGVKNNLPRGAGNFRQHFGPFVRGIAPRLAEGTTLISLLPSISYACHDAILVFSLSLSWSSLRCRLFFSVRERTHVSDLARWE